MFTYPLFAPYAFGLMVLADLFSPSVSVAELRTSSIDQLEIWPSELEELGDVADGRRRDFVMGRSCARTALTQLGVDPSPILRGSKRQPIWPEGIVGAITHTRISSDDPAARYAAAAVAHHSDVCSIGLDVEVDGPMPRGVLRRVARPEERQWLAPWCDATEAEAMAELGVAYPGRLLFTIKEAIYKTWFPLIEQWLGFEDASVVLYPAERSFAAKIGRPGPFDSVRGRYGRLDGVVAAAIELDPSCSSMSLTR